MNLARYYIIVYLPVGNVTREQNILSSVKRTVILSINLFLLHKVVFFKDLCTPCTRGDFFPKINNRIDLGIRHADGSQTVEVSVAECKCVSDNWLLLPYSTSVFVFLCCISCFDAILPNRSP